MTDLLLKTILPALGMYLFPPLWLLFFYTHKNKYPIWRTIPASALGLVLSYLPAIVTSGPDVQVWIMQLFTGGMLHTIVVCAATAAAALIRHKAKSTPKKRTVAIIAVFCCAAALGLTYHTVLLNTSDIYRRRFDQAAFTRLTQIQPEDVSGIWIATHPWDKNDETYYEFHGGRTFFAELEYLGSELYKPEAEPDPAYLGVSVGLKDGRHLYISWYADDIFKVNYGRFFYVRSAQLLAEIT